MWDIIFLFIFMIVMCIVSIYMWKRNSDYLGRQYQEYLDGLNLGWLDDDRRKSNESMECM